MERWKNLSRNGRQNGEFFNFNAVPLIKYIKLTRLDRLNAYLEYQNCHDHGIYDDNGDLLNHCSWRYFEADGVTLKPHPRKNNYVGVKEFVDPFGLGGGSNDKN